MPDSQASQFPDIFPHLRYENIKEAVAWLARVFGFRERVRLASPDGIVHVAELQGPGGGMLMIGLLSPDYRAVLARTVPGFQQPAERPFPNLSHSITAMVVDVDAHFRRAKTEGEIIVSEPADQLYGMRSYTAFDIGGHQWQFGERLRTVEPHEWGATRVE